MVTPTAADILSHGRWQALLLALLDEILQPGSGRAEPTGEGVTKYHQVVVKIGCL